jgi:hypothetical protein
MTVLNAKKKPLKRLWWDKDTLINLGCIRTDKQWDQFVELMVATADSYLGKPNKKIKL